VGPCANRDWYCECFGRHVDRPLFACPVGALAIPAG